MGSMYKIGVEKLKKGNFGDLGVCGRILSKEL
jgi:hypothetical protein